MGLTSSSLIQDMERRKMDNKSITSFRGDYAFLSNFYYAPIPYRDFRCSCVESAYQAEKCENYEDLVVIAHLPARDAKVCGRRVKVRKDWDEVKIGVMKELCRRKFFYNSGLKYKLLSTGDMLIEENNTWGDTFWGTVNGIGENHLGKILMELRQNFREGQ
jgi:ribA/ribD-fused uncharacterized protein